MELFGHDFSSTTMAVKWLCREMDRPFDYVCVGARDTSRYVPDQLRPDCKIPMINDNGFILSDCDAILRYIADEKWYPVDRQQRALVDQWLGWHSSRLGAMAAEYAVSHIFAGRPAIVDLEEVDRWLRILLSELDQNLAQTSHIAGEQLSIADISVATSLWYLECSEYPLESVTRILDWYESIKRRPAFDALTSACTL